MGVQLAAEKAGFVETADVNLTDLQLVHRVRNALSAVPLGDINDYGELVSILHHSERLTPDEVAMLVTSLKALSGAVSHIDFVHHGSLLSSICGMSLWNYGPDVMDALVELMTSLAASGGKYVDLCLETLVRNFVPPFSFLELLKQPRGLARKDQVLCHVHSALKDIAELVPLAPLRLVDIIYERAKDIFNKAPLQLVVIFVENMFRLESGSMGVIVGSFMLVAVVDRLVDLDVEIGWDDILQEDSCKGIFEMELEDEGLADDIEKDDEPLREFSGLKFAGGKDIAEKLDSLMVLTFEHLKSCNSSGRLFQVFETLMQSFQHTVLNAYKSKFSQFVMFYACSLDPENCGLRFASMLASIFTSGVYPEPWRMSAVAYLASYLARAKFLSASDVAAMLRSLADWCFDYCENQDRDINPKVHKVFYSGCQAIMYVLCFHMRSMVLVPRLKSQLFSMPIEEILKHPLNPLKVCLPSIVEEFLRQAKAAHLFTVSETFVFDGLLESELSRAFGGMERLDMFFPFDPCLLKKSDRYIRPKFVYWSMVRTTYDDDDDEGSSDEDVAEDYMGRNGIDIITDYGISRNLDEDEGDLDMNKMSITPQHSLKHGFGSELQVGMQMPSRIRPSTSPESL